MKARDSKEKVKTKQNKDKKDHENQNTFRDKVLEAEDDLNGGG